MKPVEPLALREAQAARGEARLGRHGRRRARALGGGALKRIAALLASGLLASCGAPEPPQPPKPREVRSAPVELREVDLTVTAEAVVEAVRQSTVAAQVAGRIVDLRFDVGDAVKKGELLATIYSDKTTKLTEAEKVASKSPLFGVAHKREMMIHVLREMPEPTKKPFMFER